VRIARRLLLALWAGVLVSVGGLLAPTLFAIVPDRPLAGLIAGELFRRTTLLSLALALALLVLARVPGEGAAEPERRAAGAWMLVPAGLLALSECAVRPLLEAARASGGAASPAFAAWHGVAALLYSVATVWTVALLISDLRHPR
jgi:Domain of unknown function (DUF4149)